MLRLAPWLLLLNAAATSTAVNITSINLVHISIGTTTVLREISHGATIDLSVDIPPLTIRAEVDGDVTFVKFDMGSGGVTQTDRVAPFYMGGDYNGDPHAVTTLQTAGIHEINIMAVNHATKETSKRNLRLFVTGKSGDATSRRRAFSTQRYDVDRYNHGPLGELTGELMQWHKITLGFDGMPTSETNNNENPFLKYRLDVAFTHETGKFHMVPGYYAADGNAANTGAMSGRVWLCHFAPDLTGTWTWKAYFLVGDNVSVTNQGKSASFDGATGSFNVTASDKTGSDLRAKGLLQYVGKHHLQFAGSGEYLLKAGTASPKNIFAYTDFDNTPNHNGYRKTWAPHEKDYVPGDTTWAGGKGKGLIGAINYLASQGMNAFSVQTLTMFGEYGGDDGNVFPFTSDNPETVFHYDVSKLAQWEVILEHADKMGMHVQVRTQDQTNDQLLDGGDLGPQRTVYYRELIARFSHHLALTWNLGKQTTNTDAQRKEFSDFFKANDPYGHPVVVHAFVGGEERTYRPLLNYSSFDGASLESLSDSTFNETLQWIQVSHNTGKDWIVYDDEQKPNCIGVVPDEVDLTHDVIRKNFLWGNIMAGGAGIEYFFGLMYIASDLTCEDFRTREILFNQSNNALKFFGNGDNGPSLITLSNANYIVDGGNWALADDLNTTYVLYLPNGGTANIDLRLTSGTSFRVQWYDPRNGGELHNGTETSVPTGAIQAIGNPPRDVDEDWVILLSCDDCSGGVPSDIPSGRPSGRPSDRPSDRPSSAPAVLSPLSPMASPISTPFAQPPFIAFTGEPTTAPVAVPSVAAPFSQHPFTAFTNMPMQAPVAGTRVAAPVSQHSFVASTNKPIPAPVTIAVAIAAPVSQHPFIAFPNKPPSAPVAVSSTFAA